MNKVPDFLRNADPTDLVNRVLWLEKQLRKLKPGQGSSDIDAPAPGNEFPPGSEETYDPNCVAVTDANGNIATDPDLEYPPASYAPGSEISSGTVNADDSDGVEITGLTIGEWYCIDGTGGPYHTGSTPPFDGDYYCFTLSPDGVTWTGVIGFSNTTGAVELQLPSFAVFAEAIDAQYARVYFKATGTSVWIICGDDPISYPDNTGTMGYKLRNATVDEKRITLYDVEYTKAKLADAIHTATEDTTPDATDEMAIYDSDTGLLRKVHLTNLPGGDASTVPYTPADNTDWNGSADPGNVDDALDQLADRTKTLEGASHAAVTVADTTTIDMSLSGQQVSADFKPTVDVSMQTHKLTDVVDPASNQDAATKKYVDDQIAAIPAASGGASTLLGANRWAADGGAAFLFPDILEQLLWMADNGAIVDPTTYTLSADRTEVTFDAAPTAGHVLTSEYVIAQV